MGGDTFQSNQNLVQPSSEMVVHVFDIDGALTINTAQSTPQKTALHNRASLKKNDNSLDSEFTAQHKTLLDQVKPGDVIMSGSARTSFHRDFRNVMKKGLETTNDSLSLIEYLTAVHEDVGTEEVELDTFLYGDISTAEGNVQGNPWNSKQAGESWKEIKAAWDSLETNKKIEWKDNAWQNDKKIIGLEKIAPYLCEFLTSKDIINGERSTTDKNKISQIYAILQHTAIKRLEKNKNITVKFYDDDQEILNALKRFYTQFPTLIPKGISLELYQYGQRGCKPWNNTPALQGAPINGTGDPHLCFPRAAFFLANVCKENKTIDDSIVSRIIAAGKTTIINLNKFKLPLNNALRIYKIIHDEKYVNFDQTYRLKIETDSYEQSNLIQLFKNNPSLIPSNINLCLTLFNRKTISIQGTGIRNANATDTINQVKTYVQPQDKLCLSYCFATVVLLGLAALTVGLAATGVSTTVIKELGYFANEYAGGKFTGQYGAATVAGLFGVYTMETARDHFEWNEDVLLRNAPSSK